MGASPETRFSAAGAWADHVFLASRRGRSGWTEAAVAGSLLLLAFAVYASFVWFGFDLLDEGYFAYLASRVAAGDLPYRDFSVPYTPGVFYLHALIMRLTEQDLVTIRLVQIAARVAAMGLIYLLGRRLMPPAFAVVPVLFWVVIDPAPGSWEVHPGWYALVWTLLAVWCVGRHLDHGRLRWLVAAGAAAGLAFAFKQNLAAFVTLAALWLLLVEHHALPPLRLWLRYRAAVAPQPRAGLVLDVVRYAAVPVLPLVTLLLLRRYLLPEVVVLFLAPMAVLAVAAFLRARSADAAGAGLGSGRARAAWTDVVELLARPAALGAGFALVTLPWLAALVIALGSRLDLLTPFVGDVDPKGYFLAMPPPPWNRAQVLLAAIGLPALVWVIVRAGGWGRRGLAVALAFVGAALAGNAWGAAATAEVPEDALVRLGRVWLDLQAGTRALLVGPEPSPALLLYLPGIIVAAALVLALPPAQPPTPSLRRPTPNARRPTPNARRPTPNAQALIWRWYLVAGAALMLNQYPRFDEIHLLWSSPVMLVVGGDLLSRLYRRLRESAPSLAGAWSGQAALVISLLVLPAAAAAPLVQAKAAALPESSPAATKNPTEALVPLRAGTSRFWAPAWQVNPVRDVATHLASKTKPGEPVLVFPAAPGLYYLADRPNVGRYNHLFPGMMTPQEEADLVERLEQVRYVVWDDAGVGYWVQPGDYPLLTDYLQRNYRVDVLIGSYYVLARDAAGPALAEMRAAKAAG